MASVQLSGFVVGGDGRLYQVTSSAGSSGAGMIRLNSAVLAPPGAAVSTVRQADGNLALFLIGSHGGLVAAATSPTGSGLTFFNVGPSAVAAPGGRLSAIAAPDGVHVFFAGLDGRLWRFPAGPRPEPWQPQAISAAGAVPPGAQLAATYSGATAAAVFFAAADGAIRVAANLGSAWLEPAAATPAGMVTPGGPVSVALDPTGELAYVAWCGNDVWWWLRWRWPRPPPPPPPWYGDPFTVRAVVPIRPTFNVSTAAWGL